MSSSPSGIQKKGWGSGIQALEGRRGVRRACGPHSHSGVHIGRRARQGEAASRPGQLRRPRGHGGRGPCRRAGSSSVGGGRCSRALARDAGRRLARRAHRHAEDRRQARRLPDGPEQRVGRAGRSRLRARTPRRLPHRRLVAPADARDRLAERQPPHLVAAGRERHPRLRQRAEGQRHRGRPTDQSRRLAARDTLRSGGLAGDLGRAGAGPDATRCGCRSRAAGRDEEERRTAVDRVRHRRDGRADGLRDVEGQSPRLGPARPARRRLDVPTGRRRADRRHPLPAVPRQLGHRALHQELPGGRGGRQSDDRRPERARLAPGRLQVPERAEHARLRRREREQRRRPDGGDQRELGQPQ